MLNTLKVLSTERKTGPDGPVICVTISGPDADSVGNNDAIRFATANTDMRNPAVLQSRMKVYPVDADGVAIANFSASSQVAKWYGEIPFVEL